MRPTYAIQVRPKVPEALQPLSRLAENLWFAWNPEAVELFQRLDPDLWSATGHNPLAMLGRVSQKRLEDLAHDPGFVAQMERVFGQYEAYMGETGCPFLGQRASESLKIAYFSAEYGLADCLPIYSGGLGMLSGDHLKSASDLNLPPGGGGSGLFHRVFQPIPQSGRLAAGGSIAPTTSGTCPWSWSPTTRGRRSSSR